MRLNKYLAQAGVASRRKADELIAEGAIRLNGRVVRELGTIVNPQDRVEVDGRVVKRPRDFTYLLLNKPTGVVTTMRDPQGRRTVADLLPPGRRAVPVGRLDYDTSGILLLTDDGALAHRLLHPRFGVEKKYRAQISGHLSAQDARRLNRGIALPGLRTAGASVRIVSVGREHSIVDLTIHEGQNRQVRRMFQSLGHGVLSLRRTRFGPLRLGSLVAGGVRPLTQRELAALERHRRPQAQAPRTMPNTAKQ